jgi:hypothetical protein
MMAQARWNSSSVSLTSRAKAWRWRTKADMTSRNRGSGARAISSSTDLVTSSWVPMIMMFSVLRRLRGGKIAPVEFPPNRRTLRCT